METTDPDQTIKRLRNRVLCATYRQRQLAAGKYQTSFWMTPRQSAAVRRWLENGGDISVFRADRGRDA